MINNWRCLKLNLTTCRVCIGNGMTCSDILAVIPRVIFQNCRKYNKPRSGEWYLLDNFEIRAGIIAKYHVQVVLLFVYDRSREIVGNAQETFISLRLKKHTLAFAFVVIFLRQWKKKKRQFFVKISSSHWRQTRELVQRDFFFFFQIIAFANLGKKFWLHFCLLHFQRAFVFPPRKFQGILPSFHENNSKTVILFSVVTATVLYIHFLLFYHDYAEIVIIN